MNRSIPTVPAYFLFGALLWAGTGAPPPAQAAKKLDSAAPVPITPMDDAPPTSARTVTYAPSDVVTVKAKVRYTTLIVLPKNENILDFTCGDKDYWVINGNNNFAYVKPAKAGAQTNLNLVTASGNIYSFVLTEVSETPKTVPDLKVFVELRDDAMAAAARSAPRFVSAEELDSYKAELEKARQEEQQAKEAQAAAIQQGISRFISNVRFPYAFAAGKAPFFVRAMYHDDRFTYIQARPEETPTLYEIKDGQPNLINFTYKDGIYTVDKILDRGYLAIGKQKLPFTRDE